MDSARRVHQVAIKALEEHGFLFQKRCLEEIRSIGSRYRVESEEYPVSIGAEDTVVDFVLRMLDASRTYVVFECKRAHPDYVFWVFSASSSKPLPQRQFLMTTVGHLTHDPERVVLRTRGCDLLGGDQSAHVDVGLEVLRDRDKPARGKRGRTESIYAACTQVLTGTGGLARERSRHMNPRAPQMYFYIPVVITSAELFVTSYDAVDVDLRTGSIPLKRAETRPVEWVVYDFPVPEPLQVTPPEDSMSTFAGPEEGYRRQIKVKSVAIVRATSVVEFLRHLRSPE